MTGDLSIRSGRRRRIAHAAWAALAVTLSLLMAFTKQTGHPPAIVFVPLVLIIWAVGHVVIWAIQWLEAKGQRAAGTTGRGQRPWPIGLRAALVGTGVPALIGLFQVLMTVLGGKLYPYPDAGVWTEMLAVSLAHGACFAGLLLRRRWSRLTSAMLAFGWALLLVSQIVEHLPLRSPSEATELLIACGILLLLLLLGLYLVASREVKSFLTD